MAIAVEVYYADHLYSVIGYDTTVVEYNDDRIVMVKYLFISTSHSTIIIHKILMK